MLSKLKKAGPFIMPVLFVLALWGVFRQLQGHHWQDLLAVIRTIPVHQVWLALGVTLVSYLVMTGYDMLALQYIHRPLAPAKTALASFLGYAFSNNVGFSMVAGASVRYRIYSAWGLSAIEIAQVVLFCTTSLWIGFVGLSGIIFIFEPLALPAGLHMPFASARPLGIILVLILLSYGGMVLFSKKVITIKEWQFSPPTWPVAAGQLSIAMVDWLLAGTVLFTLLPAGSEITFFHFMAIFLIAQLGGLISQVPGGLGVFESIVLLLFPPSLVAPQVLGILVVYRGIYYLLPLLVAVVLLGIEEIMRRRILVDRVREAAGRFWEMLFAPVLSLSVFLSGALLLFSGVLPPIATRLLFLDRLLPLPVLEVSHFIGSISGMLLMLLARGLQRRLDGAWVLTLVLLVIGMAASLFKGLDYEEASILLIVFIVLLPSRQLFFRRTSLFSERFSAGWIAAIVTTLIAAAWLGMFAFRHVEYSHDLWWHFSLKGNAPRFMRAGVGTLVLALIVALARLLRPAPPKPDIAGPRQMTAISAIVENSTNAEAHLALLGDKRFLMNADNTAFIMYGVSGQSWISMGDPIGPEDQWSELIWQFHRNAQYHADRTVFYEVGHSHLYLYLDMGLVALKLGEEARVPLDDFGLEGSGRKALRYIHRKVAKHGCSFEILPPEDIDGQLSVLRHISDTWLGEKNTREKGFSLGFFDEAYLRKTPVALVRG